MADKFCYSQDGERFNTDEFNSREEAVAACAKEWGLEAGDTVWTGIRCDPVPDEFMPRGYQLVEILQTHANDEGGEFSEGWLDQLSGEAEDDLEKRVADAIAGWIKDRNLEPDWFLVMDIEEQKVPETETQQA